MFTHLAFLQAPLPAAGDAAGVARELEQPIENITFSVLLPAVLAAFPASAGERGSALPGHHAALAGLVGGGQTLPPEGAVLPQVAPGPGPLVPLPAASTDGRALVDPARAGLSLSAPPAPDHGQRQGLPPAELAIMRELSPFPAGAFTRVAAEQPVAPQAAIEALGATADPLLDELPMRLTGGERAPARAVPTPAMTLSVDRPGWTAALGERVTWMVSHAQQRAEIKLDPPHLGRLDVQIVMQGERVQLAFAAETPLSRELLEQSMPRLRDMMHDAGIDLADVNVADRERHPTHDGDAHAPGDGTTSQPLQEPGDDSARATMIASGAALLDLFV